jgi:hypothetical protein
MHPDELKALALQRICCHYVAETYLSELIKKVGAIAQ